MAAFRSDFEQGGNGPPRIDHVAVIGAGFAGTLQAINLLRHNGPSVTLIERRSVFGRGVAYSTPHPEHLLNVRAMNMSALPDDPEHFVRWLRDRKNGQAQSFASRKDYGDYLAELLAETRRNTPDRLVLRRDMATSVSCSTNRVSITFDKGEPLSADSAVLALGNLPPYAPADITLPPETYVADPWSSDFAAGLADQDTVLIIGSGLTMVDVVMALEAKGFGGRIIALSRRSLMPRVHGDAHMPRSALSERPNATGAGLVQFVRARADLVGWRAAVDELRPYTQSMWLAASFEEQRRFIRHIRAWWDVHRHRLAPEVAEKIETLRSSGRLQILAGRIKTLEATINGADILWTPRGTQKTERIAARRIINATGPQGDLSQTGEPLLKDLLASGHIRPDHHRFGIDVNAQCEAIDTKGRANPRLLAIGAITRGAFWEMVAVPDIRVQTWSVARRLSNAHWVGGEGL